MWWTFVVFTVAFALSFAIRPKTQNMKPSAVNDFEIPTAEVGRPIPVLFGSRKISAPNVVWWGDLRIVAIEKKGGKK